MRALLLVALLLIPLAAGQVDSGARDPIALEGPVLDVAVASEGSFSSIGVATQDPYENVFSDADASVWSLFDRTGSYVQTGNVDPGDCSAGLTTPDCDADAAAVAISANGRRMVVAGQVDDDEAHLTLVTDLQGPILVYGDSGTETALEGAVVGMGMDDAGRFFAVATTVDGLADSGRIYLFDWGSGTSLKLLRTVETDDPVEEVAITGDGAIVVAAAGDHLRIPQGTKGPYSNTAISGDTVAVAASGHADAWTIAGQSSGFVALFESPVSDTANSAQSVLVRDTTASIGAVAINPNATQFAFGDSDGDVWLYSLDPQRVLIDRVGHISDLPGSIRSMHFAPEAESMVVETSAGFAFMDVNDTLEMLWFQPVAQVRGVGVNADASIIAAGNGSALQIYRAVYRLTVQPPAATTIEPGGVKTADLAIANIGNRIMEARAIAIAPTGLLGSTDPAPQAIKPGDAVDDIPVTVSVGKHTPPGRYDVDVEARDAAGIADDASAVWQINVPERRGWSLLVPGATSLAITGGIPVVFELNVTNEGNVQATTDVTIGSTPAGWTASLSKNSVTLQGGETETVRLTVAAPSGAAQLAQADLRVSLAQAPGQAVDLTATVGASFGFTFDVPAEVELMPGATRSFTVVAHNDGNAPDGYTIALGNVPTGWRAVFDNAQTTTRVSGVDAGRSGEARVTVTAPTGAASGQFLVPISAASLGDPDVVAAKSVKLVVPDPGDGDEPDPFPPLLLVAAAGLWVARRRR